MLDCLVNYIGLKGCGGDTPTSGQWINSLPGISMTSLQATTEDEQVTARGLWNDIQTEAINQFYVDFLNELQKCYNLKPYCDYTAIVCNNLEIAALAFKYLLGVYTMKFRLASPRLNFFTIIDRGQIEKTMEAYQANYEAALNKAALLLQLDHTDCCIDCGGAIQSVTWLP